MAINFTAPIKRSLLNFGSVLQAATHYLKDGFQPIPVKYKDKAPLNKDWQNSKSVAEDLPGLFSGQRNIGLLLGDPSGGLVDIDIDDPFAQMFAYLLLPTEMKHGRSSRPNSHHFYIVEGDLKTTQFKDQHGAMLIEIRSTGAQTVVPPSVHPSGEQLAYSAYGAPTKIMAAILLAFVSKLAAHGLLAKYWPAKGSRNEAAMALAGSLLRGGWTEEDTSTFLQSIAKAAGDEEWQNRSDCVKHTSEKLKNGEPVTGLPTLANIFGEKAVALFCKWLSLSVDGEESPVEVVQRLNKTYAVVTVGSSVRILCETFDPHTGHPDIKLFDAKDLKLLCKNQKIQVKIDSGKPVCRTADEVWLQSPERRGYTNIAFSPSNNVLPNVYNLFRGFPIAATEGDCSLYLSHIEQVICSGNTLLSAYVLDWMAHLIQKPAELPEVALVLRGKQGTGKGVFVTFLGELVGSHFMQLNAIGQVTGKFNGHLKDKLLIHADEAIWGGNKEAEGALKGLITEKTTPIEQKGKDIFNVQNYKRLIVASNEMWAVPMDMDDRRFLVLDVNDSHKEDHPYFDAIAAQMHSGGTAALMHVLQSRDISNFQPRQLPATPNGFDIKLKSAKSVIQWWHEFLNEADEEGWKVLIGKKALHDAYLEWCSKNHKSHTYMLALFGKELKNLVPNIGECKTKEESYFGGLQRVMHFKFPSLAECRTAYEKSCKQGADVWKL